MQSPATEQAPLTKDDIAFVGNLAIEAGQVAFRMREGVGVKEKTGPHDLVTEADHELSRILTSALHKRFPSDVIISEEDDNHHTDQLTQRLWLVDPIDGTDNYVKNDGQYCVMIGLLVDLKPYYGWIYGPATEILYFGGPEHGAFRQNIGQAPQGYSPKANVIKEQIRLTMGRRDRRNNPWINDIPEVEWLTTGSIGLKVASILDDRADVFAHLSYKLKVWDSAGPAAVALGAGLEVGSIESDQLIFPLPSLRHDTSIIIGKPGALDWSRTHLKQPAT